MYQARLKNRYKANMNDIFFRYVVVHMNDIKNKFGKAKHRRSEEDLLLVARWGVK